MPRIRRARAVQLLVLLILTISLLGALPARSDVEAQEPGDTISLSDGGQFLFWTFGPGFSASDVFGTVKIAWLFDPLAVNWTSFVPLLGVVDFALSDGDVLWVVSEGSQEIALDGKAPPPPEADGGDLRFADLGAIPAGGGTVTVTVQEGETSFLFVAQAPGIDDLVTIVDVTGPDGGSLLDALIEPLQNFGEGSVLAPLNGEAALTPGEYTVTVEADVATTAQAIVKGDAAGAAQVLDVTFWVATSSDEVADEAGRANIETIFRERADDIFGPFDLGIGTVRFIDAPAEITAEFGDLQLPTNGIDTSQRQLCQAMSDTFGQDRSLHFVIIDRVVDPDDPFGTTLGNAAGIPGATVLEDSSTSCVVVTANAEDFTLAQNATTAWHEAGHLLGLFHTSESDGGAFDIIGDTPECSIDFDTNDDGIVEADECPDGMNFMFHDTDATDISAEQAFVVGGNPLFQPAN